MFKLNVALDILGTPWTVRISTDEYDPRLKGRDGYTDHSTHEICVSDMPEDCNLGDPSAYIKEVIRHEVIHAFLFESGLGDSWEHKDYGHEETTVDWIAIQFPKIQRALERIYSALEADMR